MLAGMMSNEFGAQAKVNGFPVHVAPTVKTASLASSEHSMSVWREEAIPASMFEVPAGYKQKQMSTGGQ
jgi:hypothetical protein